MYGQSIDTSLSESIWDAHFQLEAAHKEILRDYCEEFDRPTLAAALREAIWSLKAKVEQRRLERQAAELIEDQAAELIEDQAAELIEDQAAELIGQLDELEQEAEDLAFSGGDPRALIARLLPLLSLVCSSLPLSPREFVEDFLRRYQPSVVPSFLLEEVYRWLKSSPQRE